MNGKKPLIIFLIICLAVSAGLFFRDSLGSIFFRHQADSLKDKDLEQAYKQMLRDFYLVNIPAGRLSFQQRGRDFIKIYKRYKKIYKEDKNKIVSAELKLAKVLFLLEKNKKALDIFLNIGFKRDAPIEDKLYAQYCAGKVYLSLPSKLDEAEFIFKRILDEYDKKFSPQLA